MWADCWCLPGLIQALDWPLRAADSAGVGWLSGQGDGRGDGPRQAIPSGGELAGLGVAIALTLLLPLGAGVGLDALLHSSPIGLLIGLLLGIVAATAFVVSQFRRYL